MSRLRVDAGDEGEVAANAVATVVVLHVDGRTRAKLTPAEARSLACRIEAAALIVDTDSAEAQ